MNGAVVIPFPRSVCGCYEVGCNGQVCEHGISHGADHMYERDPRFPDCGGLVCPLCDARHRLHGCGQEADR